MINYDQFADIYEIDMGYNIGEADIVFYLDYARRLSPVLELGCGTGRIMKPIIDNQIEVLGLDTSTKMIQQARHNLSGCDSRFYGLICSDISRFSLKKSFRLAICAFSTYSKLLTDSDQASFFESVSGHLMRGGVCLIDMFVQQPQFLSKTSGDYIQDYKNRWFQSKECWISRRKRIWRNVMPCVNKIELEYTITDLNQNKDAFTLYDYTRYSSSDEIEALLVKAGLEVRNMFSDYGKTKFRPGMKKMIFEARRP